MAAPRSRRPGVQAARVNSSVLTVLEGAINTGDIAQIESAAAILRKAPRTFIRKHHEFVDRASAQRRRLVTTRSKRSRVPDRKPQSQVCVAAPGLPFAEDIEQRDSSLEVADLMPRGFASERFYLYMAASAERSIESSIRDDEDDGRAW